MVMKLLPPIYQLKITLVGIEPPIWCRIQVPATIRPCCCTMYFKPCWGGPVAIRFRAGARGILAFRSRAGGTLHAEGLTGHRIRARISFTAFTSKSSTPTHTGSLKTQSAPPGERLSSNLAANSSKGCNKGQKRLVFEEAFGLLPLVWMVSADLFITFGAFFDTPQRYFWQIDVPYKPL
jgi:hypothetical protein